MKDILIFLGALIAVVGLFNIFIFVHELGHYFAAKWRGLKVDRFQIWFGKPIWSKDIDGVPFSLGTIPAGGFVALPQMAPMEAVEGSNTTDRTELPPVKPLDKIIVAAAGPLFSLLLAVFASCLVWWVGKPKDFVHTTEVGYIQEGSPAAEAGFQLGDKVLTVNGEQVNGFLGSLDSVMEKIMLSEGKTIRFEVERDGEVEELTSEFKIPATKWYQRRALRRVGIWVPNTTVVGPVLEGSPADQAGLREGDVLLSIDGTPMRSNNHFMDLVSASRDQELTLGIRRDGKDLALKVTPLVPLNADETNGDKAMIGIGFGDSGEFSREIVHIDPVTQIKDGLRMMWVTISKVVSRDSDVGIQHLAGPIGIGKMMYDLLLTPDGWMRLLSFVVILNVNLAVLNMLPLPILDGGHIVLAIGEAAAGRPVRARVLEVVQTAFALVLLGVFLFITSRDIGDNIPGAKKELEWPQPAGR